MHGGAPKSGIVRHPLDRPVMALQHPVLEDFQFLRRPVGALQNIPVDQPARAEQGREARRQSRGQRRAGHPFEDLLAGEVWIGPVLEVHLDGREAVEGDRPERLQARNAVQFDLDRDGDLALHFLGRVAGPLRDQLDVRRREIRIRVDGQILEGPGAPGHQGQRRDHDHERLLEREGDKSGDHTVCALLDTVRELDEEAAVG